MSRRSRAAATAAGFLWASGFLTSKKIVVAESLM
jgi:hypothetical protein